MRVALESWPQDYPVDPLVNLVLKNDDLTWFSDCNNHWIYSGNLLQFAVGNAMFTREIIALGSRREIAVCHVTMAHKCTVSLFFTTNMLKPSICRVVWQLYIYIYIYISVVYLNCIYLIYSGIWSQLIQSHTVITQSYGLRIIWQPARQSMVIGRRGWIIVGLAMYHIIFTWLVSNMFVWFSSAF
jgi:hypothetical protein